MNAVEFFRPLDTAEQLYQTLRTDAKTYEKIRNKVAGVAAQAAWRRSQRARWVFLLGVTFFAIISSAFAAFAEMLQSAAAVWVIWAASAIGVSVVSTLTYKSGYQRLLSNEQFFLQFEQIAQEAPTIEEFRQIWERR